MDLNKNGFLVRGLRRVLLVGRCRCEGGRKGDVRREWILGEWENGGGVSLTSSL